MVPPCDQSVVWFIVDAENCIRSGHVTIEAVILREAGRSESVQVCSRLAMFIRSRSLVEFPQLP